MTTCPMCDTIRISKTKRFGKTSIFKTKGIWHVNCDCGWAWVNSSPYKHRREAKRAWEKLMRAMEMHARHTAEARMSRE